MPKLQVSLPSKRLRNSCNKSDKQPSQLHSLWPTSAKIEFTDSPLKCAPRGGGKKKGPIE